jgi:hypothetical protein
MMIPETPIISTPASPTLSATSQPSELLPAYFSDEEDTESSPLLLSLLAVSYHHNCPFTDAKFVTKNVPEINQPRRLSSMPDNAEYFVNTKGELFSIVFPAELDFNGKYNRTGPYFNLSDEVCPSMNVHVLRIWLTIF